MRIYINLASEPWRNRHFFIFLVSLLAGATIITLFAGLWLISYYRTEASRAQPELIRFARMEDVLRREEKQFGARATALSRGLETEVEQTNAIIKEKSFPWSDFFNRLEQALLPACYLTSLSFNRQKDFRLEVKFRLAAPDLSSLLKTVEELKAAGFSNIQIKSEDQSRGTIISEVVMTYERPI